MTRHVITTVRNLLEADAGLQSAIRQLKANPGDGDLWLRAVNEAARQNKYLKVWRRHPPQSTSSNYIWIFKAKPGALDNVMLTYYRRRTVVGRQPSSITDFPGMVTLTQQDVAPLKFLLDSGIETKHIEAVPKSDLDSRQSPG